jgi:hypothetical protein
MRAAMSRLSRKSSAVPNTISVAAMGEKFPLYPWLPGVAVQNQLGESEKASFLPRNADPSAPTFCNMFRGFAPPPPTGESWKPVGAVRKKMLPRSAASG